MLSVFIASMIILCVMCYTGQTFFNKLFANNYPGSAAMATPVYAGIYGIVVAIVTFLLNGLHYTPSQLTLLLGLANGVILFLYNLGMIQAARRGPYAIQSIVMLFGSIVVCIIFSAIYWGDRMTVLQIVGILIMLAAFIVLNSGGLILRDIKKGYFFWVISLFFTNGIYGVLMDAAQRIHPGERNDMIITTFLSSAIVSLIYLLLTQRKKAIEALAMGKKAACCALISSISAAFAVYLIMIIIGYIPSYIMYTIGNGSLLGVSAILSWAILKEPISKNTLAGILMSVVSIIMLSF